MKHKVCDKVHIKSKEWWDAQPKNEHGDVRCGSDSFTDTMICMCGKVVEITDVLKDIADVVKKHNLGVSISEKEGNLIIAPLKVEEEEDLPIDTPVMCSLNARIWSLGYYYKNGRVYLGGFTSKNGLVHKPYDYIITFDKFNPNNIEESLKYNIVK